MISQDISRLNRLIFLCLILLNLLDNTHLKSYFDNDDYLQYLQIWENEIIPKKNIVN